MAFSGRGGLGGHGDSPGKSRIAPADRVPRNPGAFLTIEVAGWTEERLGASLETLRWLEERGYRFRRLTGRGAGPPLPLAALVALLRRPSWQESLFNLVVERS